MTARQAPLPTPFTASSTTADVLAGRDLTGTDVVVTGGHGRLGREVTAALGGAGAAVTVGARDVGRAEAVLSGLDGVRVEQLDLADPASVDAFGERWLASGRALPVLVNAATAPVSPVLRRDARGNELQLSVGHLGHFRLTRSLLPALRAAGAARVVTVSSGAARFGEIRWDDPSFADGTGYSGVVAYAQVKRANVLFCVELQRRHADDGVEAFAVHPGVVIGPGPFGEEAAVSYRAQGLLDDEGRTVIDPARGKKTVPQGAATIVFAATSPLLDGHGGTYLKDNDVAALDDEARPLSADDIPSDASSAMLDPLDARRLWDLTERLVG